MPSYKPHPDDDWVDVTSFGAEPTFLLGESGAEKEVAAARAKYETGRLTVEELEAVLERWLQP